MNLNTFAAEVALKVDQPVYLVKKVLRVALRKLAAIHYAELLKILKRYQNRK